MPDSNMSFMPQNPISSPYVVLLSGTHVTGKETLAVSLSTALSCPWLKAEMAHSSASFGARNQAEKGYDYGDVFGRIWLSKLRRLGFLSDGNESDGSSDTEFPRASGTNCAAIVTCYAMRKPARDAMRQSMLAQSVRPIFVIMDITEQTLLGRTLGAEEPQLAVRIMEEKKAAIEQPSREEKDIVLIDSTQDIDTLFSEMMDKIGRHLADA